jgi:hypothetical protein
MNDRNWIGVRIQELADRENHAMAEQFTLNLPDGLAQQVKTVAASTQQRLEEVLLEWPDRESTAPISHSQAPSSEAALLRQVNLGFLADWWAIYRGLIAQRQAETISEADLADLVGLPIALLEESLEQLSQGTNISAANWFMQAISEL